MRNVLKEITHIGVQDLFYIAERRKDFFEYPIHSHEDFEINFVENAPGVVRTVGDNQERIEDIDIVLLGGIDLPHVWKQGDCQTKDIHEITIHISPKIVNAFCNSESFANRYFESISRMFERAKYGLVFTPTEELKNNILKLAKMKDDFETLMQLFLTLQLMSRDTNARQLSSGKQVDMKGRKEDPRITKVREHIAKYYNEEIDIHTLADMANMTYESFSRFFHKQTGQTPSRYIIEYRLSMAVKRLLDTDMSISEVAYTCGFNTLSHFNRLFMEVHKCTPTEFRQRF